MGDVTKSIPLFGVVHLPEMETAALEILRSGSIANGEYVAKFEEGLARLLGQRNLVTTVDMTSAIFLALHLSGVKADDEVITTAFSCMATNSPIATIGAKPIWVDIEKNSACMSVTNFKALITPKTKAVILYHLSGYPGPAKAIAQICKKYNIKLIEDCNNAMLAKVDGQNVGSFGDFAVYSFYPNRQINTTEGGAIVCKTDADAARARKLRRFGIDAATFRANNGEINPASEITEIGWSMALNNLCSAIGYVQLKSFEERLKKTRENANFFIKKLEDISELTILNAASNSLPSYWTLIIQTDNRDFILNDLKNCGINCSKLHHRNDDYSCFKKGKTNLPNTSRLESSIIALPCGWWISKEQIEFIYKSIKKSIKKLK